MRNYTEITTPLGHTIIQYEENGFLVSIPTDPANSEYQRYLAWLENPEAEQSTLGLVNSDKPAEPVV